MHRAINGLLMANSQAIWTHTCGIFHDVRRCR
jgi:hypothetical protein